MEILFDTFRRLIFMLKTEYEKYGDTLLEITYDVPERHPLDGYIQDYSEAIDKIEEAISILYEGELPEIGTEDEWLYVYGNKLTELKNEIERRARTLCSIKEMDILKTRKIKVYKGNT
jgi:hypothetical protein